MNPIANNTDFRTLVPTLQERYAEVLRQCQQMNLSVRCEMAGKDFVIIIGPGYSNARWWMERFSLDT